MVAGAAGRRWVGKRANPGLSGQEVEQQTGFGHAEPASARLGPDVSTQVVDFPHLSRVSIFPARAKHSRILVRGMIGRGIVKRSRERPNPEFRIQKLGRRGKRGWSWCGFLLWVVTHCSTKVHEVSRKFAQIRAVVTRFYALLRVRAFFK
jgi:hypothetical protein